jgi:putative lipoic acid-binding regulatory protein
MQILDNQMDQKPEINYPTQWGFKIIGRDKAKSHQCHLGNSSSKGNFHTYNASCVVDTEAERDRIFGAFESHDDVKMVL